MRKNVVSFMRRTGGTWDLATAFRGILMCVMIMISLHLATITRPYVRDNTELFDLDPVSVSERSRLMADHKCTVHCRRFHPWVLTGPPDTPLGPCGPFPFK